MEAQKICQIPGNPDIAGVGVRTSVYIQACLAGFHFMYIFRMRMLNQIRYHFPALGSSHLASTLVLETAEVGPRSVLPRLIAGMRRPSRDIEQNQSPRDSLSTYLTILREDAKEFRAFVRGNKEYLHTTRTLERGILMVGFAVIVSAIIEARSSTGLTPYHALIILNISQINNWSGFVLLVMREGWAQHFIVTKRTLIAFIPCSLHTAMMSALGLHFWSDLKPFLKYTVASGDCRPVTYMWLFGAVDVSSVALRRVSLVFYVANAIPIIGPLLIGAYIGFLQLCLFLLFIASAFMLYFLVTLIFLIFSRVGIRLNQSAMASSILRFTRILFDIHLKSLAFYGGTIVCSPLIYTIVSTELTIRINSPNTDSGAEESWTYGQVLALFTSLVSLGLYIYEGLIKKQWRRELLKDGLDTMTLPNSSDLDRQGPILVDGCMQTETVVSDAREYLL